MNKKVLIGLVSFFVILLMGSTISFLMASSQDEAIEETITTNRNIKAVFKEANLFVENYKAENGKLPRAVEFKNRKMTPENFDQVAYAHNVDYFSMDTSNHPDFPTEVIDQLGPAPADGYFFKLWRGVKDEYFCSWKDCTTLSTEPRDFYLFGSKNNAIIGSILGCVIGLIGIFITSKKFKEIE